MRDTREQTFFTFSKRVFRPFSDDIPSINASLGRDDSTVLINTSSLAAFNSVVTSCDILCLVNGLGSLLAVIIALTKASEAALTFCSLLLVWPKRKIWYGVINYIYDSLASATVSITEWIPFK